MNGRLMLLLLIGVGACATGGNERRHAVRGLGEALHQMNNDREPIARHHSFSRPVDVRLVHGVIDWDVDFDKKEVRGSVTWTFKRSLEAPDAPLILDSKGIVIEQVLAGKGDDLRPLQQVSSDRLQGNEFVPAWMIGPADEVMGHAILIQLARTDDRVQIRYRTGPDSDGLQWLEPRQTAGGKMPYLFTQAQAILARTFLPCQDTPGVRFTYDATVRCPAELRVAMAAREDSRDGSTFRYSMPQAIPSYLVAFAVGDIAFKAIGPRTGVFAEPALLEKAAWEFADTERMVEATEGVFGPYRWERFDIIVLPPSFPFGGMENPRLTFATPTVLAGDRSLVALAAHELAHSWSGNLVTNATWSDLWMNEGFTVYLERRIMEIIYGGDRADMEAVLGYRDLLDDMKELAPADTILHIDLRGRDPDDVFSNIPYEKGYLFLRVIEELTGRERFDQFLSEWFGENAFESRTTAEFEAFLIKRLFDGDASKADEIRMREWLHEAGIPDNAPIARSARLDAVKEFALGVASGEKSPGDVATGEWTTHEWVHYLRQLPADLPATTMASMDAAWNLTSSGNSEILMHWLLQAVRSRYHEADAALALFLTSQGRRKFLKPLYQELAKTPEGKRQALEIYGRARSLYHHVSSNTIDKILGYED